MWFYSVISRIRNSHYKGSGQNAKDAFVRDLARTDGDVDLVLPKPAIAATGGLVNRW